MNEVRLTNMFDGCDVEKWIVGVVNVPRIVIKEAVERIKDGTISNYIYDPGGACLKKR